MHDFGPYPTEWREPICGAYIIVHGKTGRMYVGSTTNLYQRRCAHLGNLRNRQHDNRSLQEAFNDDPDVEFRAILTDGLAEALAIEQSMLNEHGAALFNLASNAAISFLGLAHTDETKLKISQANKGKLAGVPKTPEHRAKIGAANKGRPGASPETMAKIVEARSRAIVVDGVVYSSLSAAGRAFGVTVTTVYDRIKSSSETFKGWTYREDSGSATPAQ